MKKIIMIRFLVYLMIIIINYLLISLIVFTFSLFSLQNDKVYDLLWIKYVQQNLYLKAGINNMFTYGRIYKMKKLLRIVVLGLLLNSCSKESEQVTLDCDELI